MKAIIPELFAICAAVCWSLIVILIRKGLLTLTTPAGLIVNLCVATITLWLFAIIFTPSLILNSEAIMFLVLGGIFGEFLGVYVLYASIRRVGAAITGSLVGIHPLFSSLLAITFIGEKITLLIFLGTISIIIGVGIISRTGDGHRWKFRKLYLFIPILAGLFWGLADTVRKLGIDLQNAPFLAAAIGVSAALVCLTLILGYRREISFPIKEKGSRYFVATGLIMSLGIVALFLALRLGTVIVVAPLVSTSPLFTLLFSHVFLKGVEKVTPSLVIGAVVIVFGSALVAIG